LLDYSWLQELPLSFTKFKKLLGEYKVDSTTIQDYCSIIDKDNISNNNKGGETQAHLKLK
jgi:hypothetical protein